MLGKIFSLPTLANYYAIGQMFNVVNGQIFIKIINPSGHTASQTFFCIFEISTFALSDTPLHLLQKKLLVHH